MGGCGAKNNNKKKALVGLACVAAFVFHLYCVAHQLVCYCPSFCCEPGVTYEAVFYMFVSPVVLASGVVLSLLVKDRGIGGGLSGDLEGGVLGTNFHWETVLDMAKLSSACWVVGYSIILALQRLMWCYEYMVPYVLKGFIMCFFCTTMAMNLKLLDRALARTMRKRSIT